MSEFEDGSERWVQTHKQSDVAALETALEEARRSYDKDVAALNDIDEKAMRAGRIGIILLGIIISALAVFGPEVIVELEQQIFIMAVIGIGLILTSTILALGTYTITQYPSGIGESHREAAIKDGFDRADWLVFMLNQYGEWTDEVNSEIEANAEFLENTIMLQLVGLVCLSFAIMLGYLNRVNDIPPKTAIVGFIIFAGGFTALSGIYIGVRNAASNLMSGRS